MATRTTTSSTFVVLALGICGYSLLQSASVPTMPMIQHELDAGPDQAAWLLTAFLLSTSVFTPVVGRLGDAYGKRLLLVITLAVLAMGSVAAALAPDIESMIAARALQGVGGGVVPLAFAIVRDEFPTDRVRPAIAFASALLAVGFGIGVVVAGPLADAHSFRLVFVLPGIVAAVATLGALLVVPESPVKTREPIPTASTALFATWLVALLLGTSQAPVWGWTSWPTLTSLAGAVAVFVAWVCVEWRLDVPLVDLRLMAPRGVWSANLAAVLIGVAIYGGMGYLPPLVQAPRDAGYGFAASVTTTGLLLLPQTLCTFVASVLSARLAMRVGTRNVVLFAGVASGASLLLVALSHEDFVLLLLWLSLSGVGAGLAFAVLPTAVVASVPEERTGIATGMNVNLRTVGGALGMAVMTTIVAGSARGGEWATEASFVHGYLVLAVVAVVAGLAGLLIPRDHDRRAVAVARPAPLPEKETA